MFSILFQEDLIQGIEANNLQEVEKLLLEGADPNCKESSDVSAPSMIC